MSQSIQREFESFVQERTFPCVGAKSALNERGMHFVEGGDLREAIADTAILAALHAFKVADPQRGRFESLVVLFPKTPVLPEAEFEAGLWQRLNALHAMDVKLFPWDATASDDPLCANFGMSFGGLAFFVVGMHPGASRAARRSPRAALAFNPHRQFDTLRAEGMFDRVKTVVRQRDVALQGSPNPMLADRGERSEAAQYSGRQVSGDWRCPFKRVTA